MLRTSIRSVRALGSRPVAAAAGRQWHAAVVRPARVGAGERYYADDKKPSISDPTPAALPTSETRTSASVTPPPPSEKTADALPEVPAQSVPLTPPAPEAVSAPSAAKSTPPPPPPPPPPAATPSAPKKKGFFRRLRNYVLTISILGALAFGGGVWYSRINDNFHDFFTEYVPYGERAVLYLEESDFRKRFPNVTNRITSHRDGGPQVKIPASSGASWRVADSGEPAGRQSSAVRKVEAAQDAAAKNPEAKKPAAAKKETPKVVAEPPKPTAEPEKAPSAVAGPVPVTSSSDVPAPPSGAAVAPKIVEPAAPAAKEAPVWKAPEVDEPSRFPPASPIDPLAVNDAAEPLVQDLVHMLNDIIYVVNADGANDRYAPTIDKAKNELNKVGAKIRDLKAAVEAQAAKEVAARVDDFDKAANELVSRVEAAMASQEANWRREFEEEMGRIKASYDDKVKLVIERQKQVDEERAKNRLLEQAIELQRQFAEEVKSRVEKERDGRLGRLNELSSAVAELEKLTTGWNDVVDTNLRTQQLHVAVEAVKASLEDAAHPRPFVKELVALKEIAADDPVVNAAISSINPSAYQRGISTPAELVDRFRRVAAEVRKASLLPDDAGVASHASSLILSKLMFKKQGLAAGDDVESILTRTQTYLEEGDLDNAAREMNGLSGWAKTLSRDWLGEVRKVLEVQQALEVIQTEARLQSLKVE
ncbi:formation of crista junctions protein 1 [Coniochaeta sp. PMI_546]|nr:formation of crista junctions protein 1 [Coniochaeta sp. PMI_546]